MKRIFSTIIATAVVLAAAAQPAKHVILVSIDGFRPDFYLDPSWPAPNLQSIKANGVYAEEVRSIFPSVTYPSHTTLVTGALPARHGIYYNTPFQTNGRGDWPTEAKEVKSETIWAAAKKAGLKTASVSWPVTVGAPIDYNLPEIWSKTDPSDRRGAISESATPRGLFEEMTDKVIGHIEASSLNLQYFDIDENNSRMAAYILQKYKPSLLTIHIVSVDGAQHKHGRSGAEVRRAVAVADHAVSNLIDGLEKAGIKDQTAIIITGDHGFSDIHSALAPNVWLAEKGLAGAKNNEGWKAMFHTASGSAFLHLSKKGDTKTLNEVKALLNGLPQKYRSLFRIVERSELDKIGADPNAVLALAPMKGISMNGSTEGEPLKPAKGGTHGFYPDFHEIQTGFIAAGAGIEKGTVIPQMALEDIAPIVAKLLGFEFNAPDGKFLPSVLSTNKK
ncbi:alkaline phosphatase family protein [Desertivirga brevis]|uniref:alkaline phosphatase family protein n=1 Tax=Desertivirga brevis TaxID=2810310 RepID=UPI001A95E4C2|nr:ectonucleotide pyrophosphatase/phosphodiesterase [Pedobacter sp. SYSU D00873]